MGNIDKNAPSKGQKVVAFKSEDIATRTKAGQKKKYFVKFKKRPAKERFSEWFSKHKKKIFITMCVTVVVAVVAATATSIIISLTRPQPEPEKNWNEEINKIEGEIEDYVNSSSAKDPYEDMISHYKATYEAETNPDQKFAIIIAWGQYLTEQQQYNDALDAFFLAEIGNLNDDQFYSLYAGIQTVYIELGDETSASLYGALIDQLNVVMGGE